MKAEDDISNIKKSAFNGITGNTWTFLTLFWKFCLSDKKPGVCGPPCSRRQAVGVDGGGRTRPSN